MVVQVLAHLQVKVSFMVMELEFYKLQQQVQKDKFFKQAQAEHQNSVV